MTLKQLELFLAITDQSSFSRGAELVSLVQSTASQHIRCLEDELGSRLFDRSKKGVYLTEAGRLFENHARRICAACDDVRLAMRRFAGAEEAIVRVGASTIPAACLIPDLLGPFTAAWPGVRLELVQGDTREVLRLLQADAMELALVGGRYEAEQIVFEPIANEQILLVARPGLVTQQLKDSRDLLELPLIQREPGSGTRQVVDAALVQAGITLSALRVVAQLGSSEAVRRAVLSGAGCGFVSSLAVERELAAGALQALTVPGLAIRQQFYLATRRGKTLSPAAAALIATVRQSCGVSQGLTGVQD
jgi:DNA-binding transcriptional LysR family regulator